MRLSCPNCGAQYEVPDEVIPAAGRDVQCSNCGDTWFQKHADELGKEAEADAAGAADMARDTDLSEVEEQPAQDVQWDAGAEEADEIDETDDLEAVIADESVYPEEAEAEAQGILQRQNLDPSISDVLREEAAIEAAARAIDETSGLESQPDLGLQDPEESSDGGISRRAQEARLRMARIRGEPDPVAQEAKTGAGAATGLGATATGSRRSLLPDIEEINSTLRSTKDRRSAGDAQDPASADSVPQRRRRRGFRRGFLLMLGLMALAMLAYRFAPEISAKLPQIEPAMTDFVERTNGARVWLDGQMSALLTWLDIKAANGS